MGLFDFILYPQKRRDALNAEARENLRADTAHQREVADLRAAGLNPILAAGGSGAPVASQPTMPGEIGDPSEEVVKLMSMQKDFAQKDAQISYINQQTGESKSRELLANSQKELAEINQAREAWDIGLAIKNGVSTGFMKGSGAMPTLLNMKEFAEKKLLQLQDALREKKVSPQSYDTLSELYRKMLEGF